MIGLLDPALLLARSDAEVVRDLDLVLLSCRRYAIDLVPLEEYWHLLWASLGQPLERQLGTEAKRALQELRRVGDRSRRYIPPLAHGAGKAWRRGFSLMFGSPVLDSSWEERMASAVLRAVVANADGVVVLTRRMLGRNLIIHEVGGTTLDENVRWVLHVQPKGIGARQVLCVYHPRNLHQRWTTRFDWRLPAVSDSARYPFCPPDRWWIGSTVAFRTVSTKPAWIDRLGNAWARPNIPGGAGYHWDVFIDAPALRDRVGLAQINVVEYGAPETEKPVGHIHHVPDDKKGRITGRGWSCS